MPKQVNYCIEFKVGIEQVAELLRIYEYTLTSYGYTDEHEALLSEHIKDMYKRLLHIDQTIMKTAKLAMNNSEAMAFVQVWSAIDTSAWPLATVLLNDMVMKIDKRTKAPKYA